MSAPLHPVLMPIVEAFQARQPPRIWSLIISFLGDAILPRGGVVKAGIISDFAAIAQIDAGLVRTALSRLVARGTLERDRQGRNSFYRLTPVEQLAFQAAADRIYGRQPVQATGAWDILLLTDADRSSAREAALGAGYVSAGGTYLRPQHAQRPDGVSPTFIARLAAGATPSPGEFWPLPEIAASYSRFIARFTPVQGAVLPDDQALLGRVLLVHEYRRVLLRDPVLPADALPGDWPADDARRLFDALHLQLTPGANRWLDRALIQSDL